MPDQQPFAGLAQEISVTGLLREMCVRLADIADSVGNMSPDAAGRLRVNTELQGNIGTITTVSSVTNITALATLTNQANIGGIAANQAVPFWSQMNEMALRQNIRIT